MFPPSSGQTHTSFQEGTFETPDLITDFPKCIDRSEAYIVKEMVREGLRGAYFHVRDEGEPKFRILGVTVWMAASFQTEVGA